MVIMNWYKKATFKIVEAKVGSQFLKAKGVPDENIDTFIEYLHSLPDAVQKYLMKKFIIKNPHMTLEELKSIPVEVRETVIDKKMEGIIQRMSDDRKEREWLRNLVAIGRFKEEDSIKLLNLLSKFRVINTDRKLSDFKDDVELSEYIRENTEDENEGNRDYNGDGAKEMTSKEIGGQEVTLYSIWEQEALDEIGDGASWCVLTDNGSYEYEPFEYYCFVIDGTAEILIHQDSEQMKDRDDGVLRDGSLIKLIAPMMEEFDLSTGGGDFEYYENQLRKIREFYSNAENEEEINDEIKADAENFSLLEKAYWPTYIEALVSHVGEGKLVNSVSKEVLEYLGSHIKINKPDLLPELEHEIAKWMDWGIDNLSVGRYNKKIPQVLHTKRLNQLREQKIEEDRQSWFDMKFTNKDVNKIDYCPYPEIKSKLYEQHKDLLQQYWVSKIKSSLDPTTTIAKCPYDEIKNDPNLWKKILTDAPRHYYKCPNQQLLEDADFWLELIEKHKSKLQQIPKQLRANKEVMGAFYSYHPVKWEAAFRGEYQSRKDLLSEIAAENPQIEKDLYAHYKDKIVNDEDRFTFFDSERFFNKISNEKTKKALKKDPDVIQKYKELWEPILEERPQIWQNCPVLEAVSNPDIWKKILIEKPDWGNRSAIEVLSLQKVLEDPEVIAVSKEYWRTRLRNSTNDFSSRFSTFQRLLESCPFEDVKQDPIAWKEVALHNPREYNGLPSEVKQDPEVVAKVLEYWKNYLISYPRTNVVEEKNFPKEFQNEVFYNPQIWNEILAKDISRWKECPYDEIKYNKTYWKDQLIEKGSLFLWEECPLEDVKQDPEVRQALIESAKKNSLEGGHANSKNELAQEAYRDEKLWAQLLLEHPHYIKGELFNRTPIPEAIRNDSELWSKLIVKYPYLWNECSIEEVKQDPEILKAIRPEWESYVVKIAHHTTFFASDAERLQNCPFPDLINDPQLWSTLLQISSDWEKYVPEQLKQHTQVNDTRVNYWTEYIGQLADRTERSTVQTSSLRQIFENCPYEVRIIPEIQSNLFKIYKRQALRHSAVSVVNLAPPELLQNLEFYNELLEQVAKELFSWRFTGPQENFEERLQQSLEKVPPIMKNNPRIQQMVAIRKEDYKQKMQEVTLRQQEREQARQAPQPTAKSKDRLWSSSFNSNFIGKLS